jgi:hypothetical protein
MLADRLIRPAAEAGRAGNVTIIVAETSQDWTDLPVTRHRRGGRGVGMDQLFIWSSKRRIWVSCPPDEITWLDRSMLSGNRDLTLHRSPRCAGLRYVHHRWELFSRDTTYQVYLAPHTDQTPLDHRAVRRAAQRVLPVAPAQRYETLPVVLAGGAWLVGVGTWVLPLRLEVPAERGAESAARGSDEQPPTQDAKVWANGSPARRGSRSRPDAVAHVRSYFERNGTARMAMAHHYQEFILGLAAPQPVPMTDVVIALDLSGEGAISDYKKLLQGFIWEERGHPRELAEFLLSNGLLTHADVELAQTVALANERSGKSEMARQRLRYRLKKKAQRGESAR